MIKRFWRLAIGFSALASFASAQTAPPVTQLIERTGERVKRFWDEFSSVASTESLLQEKLDAKGKVTVRSQANFDYLIFLRWDQEGMLIDESRLAVGQTQKKAPHGALLTTQGFATLLMIFHPEFQTSYSYTLAADETPQSKLVRVHFLPRKGAASPAVLALKGREFPIHWEGDAWIDAEQAMVTRMEAHWKDLPEEIGLESLSGEVSYAPTTLKGGSQTFWLPRSARVDVKTLHQRWRNTHQFSAYRLFSVESESKVGEVPAAESKPESH